MDLTHDGVEVRDAQVGHGAQVVGYGGALGCGVDRPCA